MMNSLSWQLSLIYFFHLVATVVWIGGLTVSAWFLFPLAQRSLEPRAYALFCDRFRQRFHPLAWLCLVVLLGSGLFQMSASRQYEGMLVIQNAWSVAILLKHLGFGLMTLVNGWLTFGVYPALNRLAWLRADAQSDQSAEHLQRREIFFLRLNWWLSLLVLLFTAAARVAAGG
jgi:uncharacterized membrane protein